MISALVRDEDFRNACNEQKNIDEILLELINHTKQGNYAAAELCAEEIIESIRVIREMQSIKREHDKLVKLVENLTKQGIEIELIKKYG
ncbi:hypothetical protein ABE042_20340 [Viridibacillus arvi]|uniref:Uncharacterized protein n=1 Tax=Viridibacillus arvi TaxID=263475 RepID=A0A0M0LEN9_9BACL|nr:hypothetical protein [Viridibacillus arvi]KOO49504.1 hypothetical protein AMD00_14190 [Viridibacillus arvi]